MAITPDQAAALTVEDLRDVSDIEKIIDLEILTNFNPTVTSHWVRVSLKGTKAKVREEIRRRYQVAGWHVSITDSGAMRLERTHAAQPAETAANESPRSLFERL